MGRLKLPYKYRPRPYQLPFLKRMDAGCLRAVKVWHRRSGKDLTDLNFLIQQSMTKRVGTYFYGFPELNQGRRVLWDGIDGDGGKFLDNFPRGIIDGEPNNTEMKIKLSNGSLFQIIGSDRYNSLMSTNPVGIVFSEYSLQDPQAWGFFRPILAQNGGWAVFNFTPRGENHGYDIYNLAKGDPANWFCELLTVDDTHAITKEVLEQERKEIIKLYGNDSLYQQEYYCNFSVPIIGAYYADQIQEMYSQGRVCEVTHQPEFLVDTWWDLGINDKMAIWFSQTIGNEIRLIDYCEDSGKGLDHYIKLALEKPYIYRNHNAPHDIKVRELTTGKTRLEIAEKLGIKFKLVPNIPVSDGINGVRNILKRCWFNRERCKDGILALKNYHKQYDDTRKTYLDFPYHDWSCLVGETKILTRYGMYSIMHLPKKGEVLTPCGWKAYENPRITNRNAQLVEVVFEDGYTVRCTPDHLFLTEEGWILAGLLTKGFMIQSSLIPSHNTLTEDFIERIRAKDIMLEEVNCFTEKFGKLHLEEYQKEHTSITKTEISQTIHCQTLSAFLNISIFQKRFNQDIKEEFFPFFVNKQEIKLKNGINQKLEDYGIEDKQLEKKIGLNGKEFQNHAGFVKQKLWHWLEKENAIKNIVPKFANKKRIESVRKLNCHREVWCLTVPDGSWYCLANGTIVHNSNGADAFRMLAVGSTNIMVDRYGTRKLEDDTNKNTNWINGNWIPKTCFEEERRVIRQ